MSLQALQDLGLFSGAGTGTLLVGLFWLLATGRLVTRREHEGRILDKNAQIADLKVAAETNARQVDTMLKNDDVTHALLESLVKRAGPVQ